MLVTLRSLRKFYDIWNLLSIKLRSGKSTQGMNTFIDASLYIHMCPSLSIQVHTRLHIYTCTHFYFVASCKHTNSCLTLFSISEDGPTHQMFPRACWRVLPLPWELLFRPSLETLIPKYETPWEHLDPAAHSSIHFQLEMPLTLGY